MDWVGGGLGAGVTQGLTSAEAHVLATRLQHAVGLARYRVSVFELRSGNAGHALVEIRRARPPLAPAVVLRSYEECVAWLRGAVASGETAPGPGR